MDKIKGKVIEKFKKNKGREPLKHELVEEMSIDKIIIGLVDDIEDLQTRVKDLEK